MANFKKIVTISVSTVVFVTVFVASIWFCLPKIIMNSHVINYFENFLKNKYEFNLSIDSSKINTDAKLNLSFDVSKIYMSKNNEKLLDIKDLKLYLSLKEILFKRIIIKRFSVESCYADINRIMEALPKEEKKSTKKSDWSVDIYDALLYARNLDIRYSINGTFIHVTAKGLGTNNARKTNRRIYFKMRVYISKNGETIKFGLWDQGKVIVNNKTIYFNDVPFLINRTKIYIKAVANRKNKYNLTVYSKGFKIDNVEQLLNSNLLIPDGKRLLSQVASDINGDFDFKFNLTPKQMLCNVKVNKVNLKLTPLKKLPLTMTNGNITMDSEKLVLKDFKGFYCFNKKNAVSFEGDMKDYQKTQDTNIIVDAVVTNILMKNYISELINCPITLQGKADTKIKIKAKNNKFDFVWLFKLMPKNDILVDGASVSSANRERVLKADMHFEDMILKIKSIDYFLTYMENNVIKRKSIMYLFGNLDFKTGKLLDIGINIPDPLRSEFFNVFLGQKFLRKGTICGKIHYINTGKYPIADVDMTAENIRIPSQKLKIKKAKLISDNKHRIHLVSKGKFKRSDYKIGGNINNNLTLPIIVNNIELSLDDMDIERVIHSMNQQNQTTTQNAPINNNNTDDDDDDAQLYVFQPGLLLINDCNFHLQSAKYKDINMGNLHAKLTLDKNSIILIQSNKFDFAEGISTLRVKCDLIKHNYYVRLGVKDVNSDIIAENLLNFKKEISGKAKGLIELNTDDSLKLNGRMLFEIDNGTIAKIGLLEYVFKFVALFRNPLAMISPTTFIDLVNIPEGTFDKINGELYLKDNVIEKIMIKSKSAQLSSFIIGRMDLESRDAILRIYTKMSNRKKGFTGFLRNLSLNALANRIPLGHSNETNCYSLELKQLPEIDAPEKDCQIFLTKIDGDIEHNNFISSLKRIK